MGQTTPQHQNDELSRSMSSLSPLFMNPIDDDDHFVQITPRASSTSSNSSSSSSNNNNMNNSFSSSSTASTTNSNSRASMVEDIMKTFQRKGYKVSAYAFKSPRSSPSVTTTESLAEMPAPPLVEATESQSSNTIILSTTAGGDKGMMMPTV